MAETLTIKVADGTCSDGCGKPVAKGRRFVQGHDASLKGRLHRAFREDAQVAINGKTASAGVVLASFGWPEPAPRKARAAAKSKSAKSTKRKGRAKAKA